MKKPILTLCFSALCVSAFAGKLMVKATGANGKGLVHFILFNEGAGFPGDERKSLFTDQILSSDGLAVWSVSLPAGKPYAVAAFYDTNGNGRLDKNIFGAPTEPYGFSGNLRPLFRAPTFREASFTFRTAGEIQITLK